MRRANTPVLDIRYWVAILLAGVLGTTFGDFVSEGLGLTFAGAVPVFAVAFGLVLLAERRVDAATPAWYWLAVGIFWSMTTSSGDTVSRTLGLGYGWVSLGLVLLLAAFVYLVARKAGPVAFAGQAAGERRKQLTVNARYWVALLLAGVFGTTFGDFLSDDTGLGFGRASLILVPLFAVAVFLEVRAGSPSDLRYWAIIALVRTAGTTLGDWLTEGGPGLGFAAGAASAAALLVILLAEPWVTTYPAETAAALRDWQAARARADPAG